MFGFLATNTISQGVTRKGGIDQVLYKGFSITSALKSFKWPGQASVHAAMVISYNGHWKGSVVLNGKCVNAIDALLDVKEENDAPPHVLISNHGNCYQGVNTWGKEFILSESEAASFIKANDRNKEVIRQLIGGEEIAGAVSMNPTRWAIDMGEMDEAGASSYPEVFNFLRIHIYPSRSNMDPKKYSRIVNFWWRYFNPRQILYRSINDKSLSHVFARARTSDYHTIERIVSNIIHLDSAVIFLYDDLAVFTVLQSSVHEVWSRKYSSSLGSGMRYIVSDCFDTFPFPAIDQGSPFFDTLHAMGDRFISLRSKVCQSNNISRTELMSSVYNENNNQEHIRLIRDAISVLDDAVMKSYGWEDIELNHGFYEWNGRVRFTISESTRDEIIRRLIKLNHKRYEEEIAQFMHSVKPISSKIRASKPKVPITAKQVGFDFGDLPSQSKNNHLTLPIGNEWGSIASDQILAWLEAHHGWFSEVTILNGCGAPPESWDAAIAELLEDNFVECNGDDINARYRVRL